MPLVERKNAVSVRLSDQEQDLCELLAIRKGIDMAAVMRTYMLKAAKKQGLPVPTRQAAEEK